MKLPRRNFLHLAAGAAALPAVSRIAWAQAYPTRPITIVDTFPPGGSTGIIARIIADKFSETLGQQVIVDQRAGAGGTIAGQANRQKHARRIHDHVGIHRNARHCPESLS